MEHQDTSACLTTQKRNQHVRKQGGQNTGNVTELQGNGNRGEGGENNKVQGTLNSERILVAARTIQPTIVVRRLSILTTSTKLSQKCLTLLLTACSLNHSLLLRALEVLPFPTLPPPPHPGPLHLQTNSFLSHTCSCTSLHNAIPRWACLGRRR